MADGVTRSPSRLCSRDGKICCYGDASSTTFLLLCLSSYQVLLFFFSFLFFLSSRYVYLLPCSFVCGAAICYSQQVLYRTCSACVICILPHLGIILFLIRLVFFRSPYFSGGVFLLLCSRTLIMTFGFSLSLLSVTTSFVRVSL